MTKNKYVLVTALIVFLLGIGSFSGQCVEKPSQGEIIGVAVLDFQASGPKLAELGPQIAILINVYLSNSGNLLLVERQELEKLLNEHELGLSGTIKPETAARIGSLTGAKVIVTGRVFEIGPNLTLVAKIMGTETGRVYGEEVTVSGPGSLKDGASSLANKISNTILEKSSTLIDKTETQEDLLAKLQKAIKGKKLHSITVTIQEHHFGQPANDPAAETEFITVLHQLGFPIIDPAKSTQKPDILINGEGFSEFATRKGNLVTCKSRLEIKAYKAETGALILADRQIETALDLSERIAGKAALQNAASKLLLRVVPKL
jgi:hypothetical protein